MKRELTVGLEIHAELKTDSKMFCACKNDPSAEPNTNICPICMAHPGTLPYPNKEAVEKMIQIGIALGGKIASFSEFDRKSYFYPDIPKAYQISQYKYPIVEGGELAGVKISRVHLEEDTAKTSHVLDDEYSYIDFNRAGAPLMELVTEPCIYNAETARNFAKELQLLLRSLGASDADMERGQMRVEANISLKNQDGSLGTKVEVKNLNSFRSVYEAILYEEKRQNKLLDEGKKVIQETRGWDENKNISFSQRRKEEAADYRYFPDPDLPKMSINSTNSVFSLSEIREKIPELPDEKRARLSDILSKQQVEFFINNDLMLSLFDNVTKSLKRDKDSVRLVANYISVDLVSYEPSRDILQDKRFADNFAKLMEYLSDDKLSSRSAKDLIAILVDNSDIDLESYINENKLWQVTDDNLLSGLLEEAIKNNKQAFEDYKSGNKKASGAIIGYAMKKAKEKGISLNPQKLSQLLDKM